VRPVPDAGTCVRAAVAPTVAESDVASRGRLSPTVTPPPPSPLAAENHLATDAALPRQQLTVQTPAASQTPVIISAVCIIDEGDNSNHLLIVIIVIIIMCTTQLN